MMSCLMSMMMMLSAIKITMSMISKTLEAKLTPATLDTRPSLPPRLPGQQSPMRRYPIYANGDKGVELRGLCLCCSDNEVALG